SLNLALCSQTVKVPRQNVTVLSILQQQFGLQELGKPYTSSQVVHKEKVQKDSFGQCLVMATENKLEHSVCIYQFQQVALRELQASLIYGALMCHGFGKPRQQIAAVMSTSQTSYQSN
ncbi:hypothetical protein STEG23_000304, partial [Scotinomys teguina]